MLRYVPFVETAGMHYIGDTEGNIARVNKDMEYILSNYARVKTGEILREESAGIVDLQVFYATQLKEIEEVQGVPRDKLLRHLSDENWALLHRIFRMPKPTFIMGLTSASEKFVKARVQALGLPAKYPVQQPLSSEPRLKSPIEIQKCSLTLTSPLIRTRSTRKIQQAFGVNRDMLSTTLFSNISFVIRPGDIVLICGPSGAGKTTLLSLIQNRLGDPDYSPEGLQGAMSIPGRATISTLSRLSSSRPLVNALGRVSFERALYSLNISGLAEAHLYVKRFRELSNGQRYRAMIAKLIASDTDIWIADEYCAALDPITANIVSRNLRRCAKRLGITCILAAANWGEFINELRPDTIVHLRAPWDYRIFAWDTFKGAFSRSISLGQNR
jgi:ABC-type transport system involved in cytochrome c biogenesis ATPase subunit